MSTLSIENEIRILTNQHIALDRQILSHMENPNWDEFAVENLKKQKLLIKDKLSILYKKRHEESQVVDLDDR